MACLAELLRFPRLVLDVEGKVRTLPLITIMLEELVSIHTPETFGGSF